MPLAPLTDSETIERFLSAEGLISFTEHDQQGSDGLITDDCITYAGAFLYGRLASRFPLDSIERATIVTEFATVIAARTLCTRRGNPIPESLERRYLEIVEKDGLLDQIIKKEILLIDENGNLLAGSKGQYPTVSNLTIDRLYPNQRVRVVPQTSTHVDSTQRRDIQRFFGGAG